MQNNNHTKTLIIISIILFAIGTVIAFFALYSFAAVSSINAVKLTCVFSKLFNCFTEANSRFTTLFGLPIAFINAVIFIYGIIALIVWFFAKGEKKKIIISTILFLTLLATLLGIFTQVSLLIFKGTVGVFYPLMLIINAFFTITFYKLYKYYLKEKIFNKEKFDEYKKQTNFNKLVAGAAIIFVLTTGIVTLSYLLIKTKIQVQLNKPVTNNGKIPDKQIQGFIEELKQTKTYKINVENFPSFGNNSDNAVKIIKFTNFACHYCQKLANDIEKYIKEDNRKIKVYVIPMNFDTNKCMGEQKSAACLSVYASYLAYKKGVFEKFYNYLYLRQGSSKRKVKKALLTAGIHPKELKNIVNNENAKNWIQNIFEMAEKYKIDATPTYFVNGKRLDGYVPYKLLKNIINKAHEFK